MKDLQPYLDFFDVLRTYAGQGLLEILPAAHEAYITASALYTLSYADDLDRKVRDAESTGNRLDRIRLNAELFRSLVATANNIRTYAAFINASAEGFKEYQQASEGAKDTPATKKSVEQAAENMRKPQVVKGTPLSETFALHVVGENHPHPLKYTILATAKRRWYAPWKKRDEYEVITY